MINLKAFFPLIVLSFFLPSSQTFSSAPAVARITLPPLNVELEENFKVKAIGLEGQSNVFDVNKKLSKHEYIFQRVVFPNSDQHLIVIAEDPSYAPLKVKIPHKTNHLKVSKNNFKKREDNVLWIWGQTPQSPCGGHTSLHLRFLKKKSIYTNLTGLFVWKIDIKELPLKTLFYLRPQLDLNFIDTIKSSLFLKANQTDKALCAMNQGSQCSFVYNMKRIPELFEILFTTKDLSTTNIICPV
ncbi:MAG: hypothetical protein CME60_08820 [Halobacteriovoraceae bacterium]|nr:hypothetical protein [Halobacteriovoraceae bacterium]